MPQLMSGCRRRVLARRSLLLAVVLVVRSLDPRSSNCNCLHKPSLRGPTRPRPLEEQLELQKSAGCRKKALSRSRVSPSIACPRTTSDELLGDPAAAPATDRQPTLVQPALPPFLSLLQLATRLATLRQNTPSRLPPQSIPKLLLRSCKGNKRSSVPASRAPTELLDHSHPPHQIFLSFFFPPPSPLPASFSPYAPSKTAPRPERLA